jgi:hypothetical protein
VPVEAIMRLLVGQDMVGGGKGVMKFIILSSAGSRGLFLRLLL